MTDTERKKYEFRPRGYGDGTGWIMLQYLDEDLSCLRHGFLGLDVKAESQDKIEEIAAYLNTHVEFVTFTKT